MSASHRTSVPHLILLIALSASTQEGHQTVRVCPEGGNQDCESPQKQDLWRVSEPTRFVHLEKRRWRDAFITASIFQNVGSRDGGADLFSLVRSKTWGNRISNVKGNSDWTLEKVLHKEGGWWVEPAPQRSGHSMEPDKNSVSTWMIFLVIWFSFSDSCKKQRVGFDDTYKFIPTSDILWFCWKAASAWQKGVPSSPG